MNSVFEKIGFYPADILLPKDCDMTKWAVVACDQFTSEPEYWVAVEQQVGDAPSALRLILPEAQLKDPNVDALIAEINAAMDRYLAEGVYTQLSQSLLYIERQQSKSIIATRQRSYQVYETVTSLCERIGDAFLRINQGMVVNISMIQEIKGNVVFLKNGMDVTIGRTYRKDR